MLQAKVKVGDRSTGHSISPLLYGHFIEFIRDGISGIWAEMVANRSFEQPGARPHLAHLWEFEGDCCRAAVAGGPSPTALRLRPAAGAPATARQGGLWVLPDMTYSGSAWLWTAGGDVTVRIAVLGENGAELAFTALTPARTPARLAFRLAPSPGAATLVITASGAGTVYLDQLSLMPDDNEDGWRHDVLELIRGLKPPFIRFPGGCFADVYHWRDGVGERDRRPTRFNHAWKHVWERWEGNEVGTAEFIALCRRAGCEPLMVVNFGSATPQEAAEWVEYCNGDASTEMGRLRGAPPFGVKLWEIGNEPWGHWEVGCCDASAYTRQYLEFRSAMLAVDPGLTLLATGSNANETDQAWNESVADLAGADMDYLTLHYYAPQLKPEECSLPESVIYEGTAAAALKLEESLLGAEAALSARGLIGKVSLAVTEWNTMYTDESGREMTLGAAVCNATFFSLFLRHSPLVGLGAFSDLVDGWEGGLIRSGPAGAYGTPTYWVFSLYARHEGRYGLAVAAESPAYDAPALGHLPGRTGVPLLDVAATESADGSERWLFLVNRSLTEPLAVAVDPGISVEKAVLSLIADLEIGAANSYAHPHRVAPNSRLLAGSELHQFILPPHAVARLWVQKGVPAHD